MKLSFLSIDSGKKAEAGMRQKTGAIRRGGEEAHI